MEEEKPNLALLAKRSRLEHSTTIVKHREALAQEMLGLAASSITDVLSWDDDGNIKIKSSKSLKQNVARSIKKIRTYTDKEGKTQIELEMHDKVALLRLLAKAAGLLEQEQNADKPSVIGINIRAPVVINQDE